MNAEKAAVNGLQEKDKRRVAVRIKKTLFGEQVWRKRVLGLAAAVSAFCLFGFVSEAAEGKIKADTAKIRAEASTGSEVVGSTVQGKTIDILDAVKDNAGMVWYKVSVTGGSFGYIRSDLVETSETIEVSGGSTASESNTESEESKPKPAETVPTAITEQKATVSQASVRIRSGASTSHDTVASLPQGTGITLIGEASDSAGNKWYQMTCSYNNKTVEGYIRSDLITIGGEAESNEEQEETGESSEEAETTEGEPAEGEAAEGEAAEGEAGSEEQEEQPAEPEYNDYEVVYTEEAYWLYDNVNGTRQRLEDLMNVVNTANQNNEVLQGQIQKEKIIVIVLAVFVVILVITVTLLLFKIRSLYYEDYEEEEEEEEPEPVPVRKKARRMPAEEEEPAPVRRKRPAAPEEAGGRERPAKERTSSQRTEGGEKRMPRSEEQEKPAPKKTPRRSQNFLLDDDEFEFEFLNMDDKDL